MDRKVTYNGRALWIDHDDAGDQPTVGDLTSALGRPNALSIDERCPPADGLLEDWVHHGSRIEAGDNQAARPPVAAPALAIIAGPDAGRRVVIAPGGTVLGRSQLDDPTVSSIHAWIRHRGGSTTIEPLPTRNGVRIGGTRVSAATVVPPGIVAWLGATAVTPAHDPADAPDPVVVALARVGGGRIAKHRPPRPARPPLPTAPAPPTSDRSPLHAPTMGVSRLVVPLISGLVLAVVFDPRLAVIGLIGPISNGVAALAHRRKSRRQNRLTAAQARVAFAEFSDALVTARDATAHELRRQSPDLAEVVRRAETGSARLWERRAAHDDFLAMVVGHGDVAWDPGLRNDAVPEAQALVERVGLIIDVPVVIDLDGVVGIVGPRDLAAALARSVVIQAAVLHGPADVAITVFTLAEHSPSWTWASWLPHCGDARHPRVLTETDGLGELLAERAVATTARELLVVDGDAFCHGRDRPARDALAAGGRFAGVVVAADVSRLPSSCRTVIQITDRHGRFRVVRLDGDAPARPVRDAVVAGASVDTATRVARSLARYVDPDADRSASTLAASVTLIDSLGVASAAGGWVAERWVASEASALPVAIGVDEHGIVEIDLVADGPHAVIGGTTGSGKSELLRSLVAGLAATHPPDLLAMVLVDYKGGSAFDRCVDLPHVAGLVTDLDAGITARVRDGLGAEIRRREHLLRDHACDDLIAYAAFRAARPELAPMPRIVVVVDEVATLLAEQPGFIDALVDLAQRGRSLGFHLVLATQRPAGAIRESVWANVNLRIALRTADDADSRAVVGATDAATISRRTPGRAIIRRGPGDLVHVQTARVTGTTPVRTTGLRLRWVDGDETSGDGPAATDLERIVEATTSAAVDHDPVDRLWLDPLPTHLAFTDIDLDPRSPMLTCSGSVVEAETRPEFAVVLGRGDLPAERDQPPVAWVPASGPLVVIGAPGSGTTTTLRVATRAIAAQLSPDAVHVYVLANDSSSADLAGIPHVGAVAAPDDPGRRRQLLHLLRTELDERRSRPGTVDRPHVVVAIDDAAALLTDLDECRDHRGADTVRRLVTDGTAHGVFTIVTLSRAGSQSASLWRSCPNKLVLATVDPADRLAFGLRPDPTPDRPAGRATIAASGVECQIAWVDPADPHSLRVRSRCLGRGPRRLVRMPDRIPAQLLEPSLHLGMSEDRWLIPVGVDELAQAPAVLGLDPGSHALVIGPPHSGRTTLLKAIASLTGDRTIVIAGRHRAWADRSVVDGRDPAAVAAAITSAQASGRPTLVLVDDADQVSDPDTLIDRLVAEGDPGVRIIAATRADRLRSGLRHWTAEVRRHRTGVLIDPEDHDGDLLGIRLGFDADRATARIGRGVVVVDGVGTRVRFMQPSELTSPEGARA